MDNTETYATLDTWNRTNTYKAKHPTQLEN